MNIYKSLTLSIIFIFIFYFIYHLNIIEGDPAIYLTFAKTFFNQPFSFGDFNSVKFGATSPIFLFIISGFHYLFSIEYFLYPFKIFTLLLFIISLINYYRIVKFINNEYYMSDLKNKIIFSTLIYFAINFFIYDNGIRLYESFLTSFFISSIIYLSIQKKTLKYAVILSGFSYLIRPELALFQILLIVYSWHRLKYDTIVSIILSILPILFYHLYMYSNTGLLIPSSIYSRATRFGEISIFWSYRVILKSSPEIILSFLLMILSLLYIKKEKIIINQFFILMTITYSIFGLIVFLFTKAFTARYLEVPILVCAPLVIFMINKIGKKMLMNIFLISIIIMSYKLIYPTYSYQSDLDTRLAKRFAKKINKIIPTNEKIAIYEIQTQYYINAHVISFDGRVGNEFLPMLNKKQSFIETLKKHDIKYFSIDENLSEQIKADSCIQFMIDKRNEISVNESINYKGNKIEKIFEADQSIESFKMYGDIFKIIL